MIISSRHLKTQTESRKVTSRFRRKADLKAKFAGWNRQWQRGFTMRIVEIEDGGYAGVIRIKEKKNA